MNQVPNHAHFCPNCGCNLDRLNFAMHMMKQREMPSRSVPEIDFRDEQPALPRPRPVKTSPEKYQAIQTVLRLRAELPSCGDVAKRMNVELPYVYQLIQYAKKHNITLAS